MTKRKKKSAVDITIAVMCSPRNDALAIAIVERMAEAAAKLVPAKQAQVIRGEVTKWKLQHGHQ